mgnify:CR=1 FL=1
MIDKQKFFNTVKTNFNIKHLTKSQVAGIDAILDHWEISTYTDLRWLAYMLATVFHETARTMQPIEEYGKGKGKKYGEPDPITKKVYYGRGYVQLTWKANYYTMGKILQIDLVNKPELALDIPIAIKIMFEGMTTSASMRGDFTGKCLEQFFNNTTEDWINARKIINGLDCAKLIAEYGKKFLTCLQ